MDKKPHVVSSNDNIQRTPSKGKGILSVVPQASFNQAVAEDYNPENDNSVQRERVFKSISTYLAGKYAPMTYKVEDETSEHAGFPYQLFNVDAAPVFARQHAEPRPGLAGLYLVRIYRPNSENHVMDTLYTTENGEAVQVAFQRTGYPPVFTRKSTGESSYPELVKIFDTLPIKMALIGGPSNE